MAFQKPKRPISKVFIHCSASSIPDHGNVDVVRGWHKKRGWSDIGYHYFIPFSGEVQLGRDIEKVPAAQYNHNMRSLAICLHGLRLGDFTYGQFSSLVALCKQINSAYSGYITFHGHKEVSYKECPVFDYKNVLKLDEQGHLKLHELNPPKYLSIFSSGLEVINLQHQLNMHLADLYKDSISSDYIRESFNNILDKDSNYIRVDGIFGQQTQLVLIEFQIKNGLEPDGIVGPETRLRLPVIHKDVC